ncbi:MAG: LEA type 2 family protein [Chitinophagales bacterium]
MKNILIIVLFPFLIFTACEGPKDIVFQSMNNVRVTDFANKMITIEADAVLHNPNLVSVNLVATDVILSVEGAEVGRAVQTVESVSIPAMSDFSVPLSTEFALKKLGKGGILGTALSVLTKKNVEVHYKGTVTVRVMDIDFDIPVDYKREVEVNL